jgi:hypothetical protein
MQADFPWPRYPPEYPFEALQQFVQSCQLVTRYFGSQLQQLSSMDVAATTTNAQEGPKLDQLQALGRVSANRWGSILAMLKTLKECVSVLEGIANDNDFVSATQSDAVTVEKLHQLSYSMQQCLLPMHQLSCLLQQTRRSLNSSLVREISPTSHLTAASKAWPNSVTSHPIASSKAWSNSSDAGDSFPRT